MEELVIDAKIENLNTVLDFVAKNLKNADCPLKQQYRIAIVIEEIFVNIAHYAYGPQTGAAAIRVTTESGIATIEFEDGGKPYNPLEKDDPDITLGTEERDIGGLGVYMVKNMVDSADYRREGDRNILTVVKRLGEDRHT